MVWTEFYFLCDTSLGLISVVKPSYSHMSFSGVVSQMVIYGVWVCVFHGEEISSPHCSLVSQLPQIRRSRCLLQVSVPWSVRPLVLLVPVTILTTVGRSFMNSKIAVISQVSSFQVHTIWLGLCLNSKVLDMCVRGLDWSTTLQINTEFIPFQPNSRSPHHRKRKELRLVTQGSLLGGTQTLTCSLRNGLLILLYSLGTTSVSPVGPSLECHVSAPCSRETSDWLLSLGNKHLRLPVSFCGWWLLLF